MFMKGAKKHFTGMENNFNKHVVPHIICHNSTWKQKARVFYLTATPILGEKLKEKLERAANFIRLDVNSRILKFDCGDFYLERDANHTSYYKTLCDKSKQENTKVQDDAFDKYVDHVEQRNADLDYINEQMNKYTCHMRQEIFKFLKIFLTLLGQKFPAVKERIDQISENVIQFDDYFDETQELSAAFIQVSVMNFVNLLASDQNSSQNGLKVKDVIEIMKNLLKNVSSLDLVYDEECKKKFENIDDNKIISAENLCRALELMVDKLKRRNNYVQAGNQRSP